ncbi:hypothetical protein A8W25_11660 [Streptomyces sp. ERV7]|nr:hypothetical protein A8W25_11660 [Streptomyces sp. ERV7]
MSTRTQEWKSARAGAAATALVSSPGLSAIRMSSRSWRPSVRSTDRAAGASRRPRTAASAYGRAQ